MQSNVCFFFPNQKLCYSISEKFSFWILRAIAKFCFLRIVLNRAKYSPVLIGTTHRKLEYLETRRTYA